MKTDTIFYQLFQNYPRSFFELIGQPTSEVKNKAVNLAKQLLNKARQEIADEAVKLQVIELIETIVLYKFPEKSRQ